MKYKKILSFYISRLETCLGNIAPKHLLKFRKMIGYGVEPELVLLPFFCDKKLLSLDIGANAGMYTHHMLRYSKMVHAFEPNPRYIRRLLRCFPRGVLVHPVALSNIAGVSELRIPLGINGAGSLEKANDFGGGFNNTEIEVINVPMKRLDDFEFKNVGFIKIDVEGYEASVLEGGIKTITESKPSILIEIEERHRPGAIRYVNEFFLTYGYSGFFLENGALHSIDKFNIKDHQSTQNIGIRYINNFLFLAPEHLEKLKIFK
jgi:FkbM family methyltransferase